MCAKRLSARETVEALRQEYETNDIDNFYRMAGQLLSRIEPEGQESVEEVAKLLSAAWNETTFNDNAFYRMARAVLAHFGRPNE